jgi:hypothetical protein
MGRGSGGEMGLLKRGLKQGAFDALTEMAESPDQNWWKDLLAHWTPSGASDDKRPLRLAIRDNTLNFHLKGQSVARVEFGRRCRPFAKVHLKYAFEDASEKGPAQLTGTEVLHRESGRRDTYAGPATLREWMARAAKRETPENAEVERVVANNSSVIDLEMETRAQQRLRMDLVALEADGDLARIVFWEAKRAVDGRFKTRSDRPEVMTQIEAYRSYLGHSKHRASVIAAYRETCRTLLGFAGMAGGNGAERLDPLLLKVANDESELTVDETPRLMVFGTMEQFSSEEWIAFQTTLKGRHVPLLMFHPEDAYRLSLARFHRGIGA